MRNNDTHFRIAKNSEQPARCEAMVTLLHRTTMEDCLAAPVKTQTFHHVIHQLHLVMWTELTWKLCPHRNQHIGVNSGFSDNFPHCDTTKVTLSKWQWNSSSHNALPSHEKTWRNFHEHYREWGGGRKEGGAGEDSANLENVCAVWLKLYSTLEKTKLWIEWLPRVGGGRVEKTEHRLVRSLLTGTSHKVLGGLYR